MDPEKILTNTLTLLWRGLIIILWLPVSLIMWLAFFLTYHFHDNWIEWTNDVWEKIKFD